MQTLLGYIIINRYKVQFRHGNLKRSESDVDAAPSSHLVAKKGGKNRSVPLVLVSPRVLRLDINEKS